MKRFRTITAATALIATLAACSNTENLITEGTANRTALSINAGISTIAPDAASRAGSTTRAENTTWHPNDAIGILMLDAGTDTPTDGKTNYRYHTTTGTGSFIPADKANTAYFPTGGAQVDLIAYYPHTDALAEADAFVLPIDVTDQSDLAAIDLMTAPRTTGHSSAKPEVPLTFAHRLSKLVLNVKTDASTADINLAGATATLTGMPATAQWDLLTETLQPSITQEVAPIALPMTPDGTRATAILIPTAAGAGKTLTLATADGRNFTARIADNLAFEAGTVNTYTLTLKRGDLSSITATVLPWAPGMDDDATLNTDPVTPATLTGITEAGTLALSAYAADGTASDATGTYPVAFDPTTGTATFDTEDPAYAPMMWGALAQGTHTYAAIFRPTAAAPANHEADILGGNTAATPWGTRPQFGLKHLMARFTVKLACTDGTYTPEQLAAATINVTRSVRLTDITPSATTIALSTEAATGNLATVALAKTDDAATFAAILCPQVLTATDADVLLTLTITGAGNVAKSYTLKKALTLAAAQSHTITANISGSSLMPTAIGVEAWTEVGGTGDMEIQ